MKRSKRVRYPSGKLSKEDEGELSIAVFIFKGTVRIEFRKPVAWFAMPPDRAKKFAELILRHANTIEVKT